ncbi:hypothetical protein GQ457_03G005140 [Hibiscus cannabinus]
MGVGGFCFDPNVMVLWGKRKVARLVWKVRAEMKLRTSKQRFSFHYDPFSYALNFDNGDFEELVRLETNRGRKEMGCLLSTPDAAGGARRRPKNIGEIVVFVPGLRIPRPLDFAQPLGDGLSKSLVERLSALRTRIEVMAGQEAPMTTKPRRTATQHGGSTLTDLQQALEDYLPVLLGLVENGNRLKHNLRFCWINQEEVSEETTMSDSWYEVLSVLHLMAILLFSQANLLLLPSKSTGGYQNTSLEDCKRASIDIFLKAAGYLDFAVQKVLPQLPLELRNDLPLDLTEGVLKSLCLQALGQGVEIQLGMAIDSIKATLAVKRRLACEMVKYWHQAHEYIKDLPLENGWGEKHKLLFSGSTLKLRYDSPPPPTRQLLSLLLLQHK